MVSHNPRAIDNPKHKKEQEHTHNPHVHPAGYYDSHVPHTHTVKYRKKDGTEKTYKYPYEVISSSSSNRNKRLRNR